MRISVGVSVRLFGMAEISMLGDSGVGVMRVDGERQQLFQGLVMLLMGSMLRDS